MVSKIEKVNEILQEGDAEQFSSFTQMMETLLKVIVYLNNAYLREDKLHSFKKEEEIIIESKNLKKAYQSKKVLALNLVTAGLTTAGGLVSMGGVIPGTGVGTALSNTHGIFSLFGNAANAQKIASLGSGISGVGQGTGVFEKVLDSGNQGKRVLGQHTIQVLQAREGRVSESARSSKGNVEKTINAWMQHLSGEHNAKSRMMSQST
jgi:hypothetical protein